ncbi:hypothetical protein Aperf_G00000026890 [Anoplocephala perfoliata]
MQCSLREDLTSEFSRQEESKNDDNISEAAWQQHLLEELNDDIPQHEGYFEGFQDAGTASGDFFEDIRKEYERRRRKQTSSEFGGQSTNRPSTSADAAATSAKAEEFRQKHAEGLRKRGLAMSSMSAFRAPSISYNQYSKQWKAFLHSGTSQEIPWPPIKVGDMDVLLRFVGESMVHLRQLQVDWHPDRFFARLPSSIQPTDEMRKRVTALSQFLNNAVMEFRGNMKKARLE